MKSPRPYLVRALIDWIMDSACTPHVVIAADAPGADALRDYATENRLVLNVSDAATRNLSVGDRLEVDCRFGGRPVHVSAPIGAVVAVYARENSRGMAFDIEQNDTCDERKPPAPPKLSLVK